jgi:hypothetical protein
MLEEIRKLGATEQVNLITQYRKLNFFNTPYEPSPEFCPKHKLLTFLITEGFGKLSCSNETNILLPVNVSKSITVIGEI